MPYWPATTSPRVRNGFICPYRKGELTPSTLRLWPVSSSTRVPIKVRNRLTSTSVWCMPTTRLGPGSVSRSQSPPFHSPLAWERSADWGEPLPKRSTAFCTSVKRSRQRLNKYSLATSCTSWKIVFVARHLRICNGTDGAGNHFPRAVDCILFVWQDYVHCSFEKPKIYAYRLPLSPAAVFGL